AANEISSYRALPKNFYQIQTKFRDEIRPRFGLMRAKEFIMKDAYSFDTGWDQADGSYQAMYDAYVRIFRRCGLRTKIVEADTGAMGGSSSHEFMVLADAGEDGLVECDRCSYAANLERAEGVRRGRVAWGDAAQAPEPVSTPGQKTIEQVSAFLKIDPARLLKTLIYVADGDPVAVVLPGDREVNEIKLRKALGAGEIGLAADDVVQQVTGAPVGFAGPVGLTVRVIAEQSLEGTEDAVTGANQEDVHLQHVTLARDVPGLQYHDLMLAAEGDGCPRCTEGTLQAKRGIEVGHVFKLGTKYSETLGALFLDAEGKQHPMVMGCYGIGVTRTLQSIIEQSHDDNGILWPIAVAPYAVEVMAINAAHEESARLAGELVEGLEAAGIDVLYDDRDERPGVKFKDADLIGLPLRVSVGERSLARGEVEMKDRRTGEVANLPVDRALAAIIERVKTDMQEMNPS
ncbi:MAG: proline--tRNA ligase, partial [Kiritimatiellae bacterium]|nr:proline--tRNA ligase [Kiritimatiellia bacterium]